MFTIAKRQVAGLLALAQVGIAVFFCSKGLRRKSGSLVFAITEGLVGGFSAGAEEVFFPFGEIDGDGFDVGNGWFFHG